MCLAAVGLAIWLRTGESAYPKAPGSSESCTRSTLIAALVFSVIVGLMWGAFAFSSGMGYETVFSWQSQTSTILDGFVDLADTMRPFTNLFYHLSYLFGVLLGVRGSFVPFQFVYAALWWSRGFLVFLILRRMLGGQVLFCYIAGSLVLIHASDGALQWIGQLNQFGYIAWMLLGFYALIRSVESIVPVQAYIWGVLACLSEFLCLWSYESGMFIIALVPLMILLCFRRITRQFIYASAGWYAVTVVYVFLTVERYATSSHNTYQASVLRTDFHLSAILSDWIFNILASVSFWSWPSMRPVAFSPATQSALACAAVAAFAAGGAWLGISGDQRDSDARLSVRHLAVLLGVSFLVLIASFPAYLLLASARQLWRTQFLSGIGTGVMMASAVTLVATVAAKFVGLPRRVRTIVSLILASPVIYFGAASAIERGSFHRSFWENQRQDLAKLIRIAPRVKPGTLIALVGVPRNRDPFGNNMWFDVALRLVYPGVDVAGFYFRDDNKRGPGDTFKLENGKWHVEGSVYRTLFYEAAASDVVFIEDGSQEDRILTSIPSYVCPGGCPAAGYNPSLRILPGPPAPEAINRYGPL